MTLRDLRQAAGLSQTEVASRAEVSQATVSALEQGTASNPSLDTLRGLARALECSLPIVIAAVNSSIEPGKDVA